MDQGIARIDQYFQRRRSGVLPFHLLEPRLPECRSESELLLQRHVSEHQLRRQYVHTFSATLLNEARFGWINGNVSKLSPRTDTDFTIESLGIHGLNVGGPGGRPLRKDEQGFPVINIDGFMGMGDGRPLEPRQQPYLSVRRQPQPDPWGHSLKFGADIRRLMDDATTNNWPFSHIAFTGDISGLCCRGFHARLSANYADS